VPAKDEKPGETAEKPAEKPKPKAIPGFVGKVAAVDGKFVTVKGAKTA